MDYRDLPYDAELEYLESTGAYITLPIVVNKSTYVCIEYSVTKTYAEGGGADSRMFGVWQSNATCALAFLNASNQIRHRWGQTNNANLNQTKGNRLRFTASGNTAKNENLTLGTSVSTTIGNSFPDENFKLFHITHGARIYSAKIGNFDLIPVRVGNVGYMYDKVTGQLFGNSGTGSFILGPDVAPGRYANEIAFLESTGSQYIDTGINADSNMGFSMTYSFTDLLNDIYSRMGAIRQSESNYIRHHTSRKGTSNSDIQYMLPTFTKELADATNKHTLVLDTVNSSIGYDGEVTTYSESAFDCNLNYYLFARNEYLNDAASISCAKIKIYQAKIYSNGVLVRDFIPVEYNNIGYLYDKVSGEFFANQGTGKFVLGHRAPRFDGKACARSYTRRQLMAEIAYPKPYISNGLIFHLDGKDANGSTWVDRIGGKVLTLYNTTLQNGGVRFTGNRHCRAETEDGVTLTAPAASSTIEIVGHRLTKRSIEMIFSPGVNSSIFYVGRNTYVSLGVNVRLAQFTAPLPVGKFTHSLRATLHYYNGTKMTTTGSTVTSNQETNICVGGNETAAGNLGFNGIIYQIRIYNRLLTEDEIKWNQEQDRKRYGIQF